MTLTVLSILRDAARGQAQRFLAHAAALRDSWPDTVRVVASWGDCRDATAQVLASEAERHGLAIELVECSHGIPKYGSVDRPERMKAVSIAVNAGLAAIVETDELVLYVESDLLWQPPTIMSLAESLGPAAHIIAPMIFVAGGGQFYDIWAYRRDGHHFSPFPPYFAGLQSNGLTEVSSVGSCLLMTGEVARTCRLDERDALVGFCRQARARGYHIAVKASCRIEHPA